LHAIAAELRGRHDPGDGDVARAVKRAMLAMVVVWQG
jgi:hypothetical protein